MPLIIFLAVFIWGLMTFFKWCIARNRDKRWKKNAKKLEQVLKSSIDEAALQKAREKWQRKVEAEEAEKIERTKGIPIWEEVELRKEAAKNGKKEKPRTTNKYTPDLFEDSVTILLKKQQQEQESKTEQSKKND